jgi:hypothetical protein
MPYIVGAEAGCKRRDEAILRNPSESSYDNLHRAKPMHHSKPSGCKAIQNATVREDVGPIYKRLYYFGSHSAKIVSSPDGITAAQPLASATPPSLNRDSSSQCIS